MIPQVGDKVVISNLYNKRIDTVVKVTKTQATVSDGTRFVIKTGRAVGDAGRFYRRYFQVVTPEKADELSQEWEEAKRKSELVTRLSKYRWQDQHISTLEKVAQVLEEACPTPAK